MVSTTEFDELIEVLRDFIRREVMPAEAGIDESDEIPGRLIAQAKEMGLYGYARPAEFGGLGLSVEQQVLVTMELGYTSPAFRSLFGTNNGIAGQVLVLAGTEEQRKHWLPRLASGEGVAAFALTAPGAGSDPRPGGAAGQGHRRVHRPGRAGRGFGGGQGPQDGPGRRVDRRRLIFRRPGPPRRPGRRGGRGRLLHRDAQPGPRAADHRGPVRGRGGAADRRERDLRQGTLPGRPPDRRLSAGAGHAGGLADRVHGGPGPGARRRGPVRRRHRPAARPVGGQVLRQRGGGPDRRPGGADPWRFGVHARGPGRAAVPRRAPVPDLRGHQPDPATPHRPGDAAVALRVGEEPGPFGTFVDRPAAG